MPKKNKKKNKRQLAKAAHAPPSKSNTDEKISFLAAIDKYWDELSIPWQASSTQLQYRRDYEKLLAPYFADKPLAEYNDPAYFPWLISDLEKKLRAQKRPFTEYSLQERLQHCRYILKRAMDIISVGEGFLSPLLGFESTSTLLAKKARSPRAKFKIQKSFSPLQECRIADILFQDVACDGRAVGIALMWSMAYRNKEACGLSWGDYQVMPENEEHSILILHTTTIGSTREIHSIGKNDNMYRILPVPPRLKKYLDERKAFIRSQFSGSDTDFAKMPMVCKGTDWALRATSDELSVFGKMILNKINLTPEQEQFFAVTAAPDNPLDAIAWDSDPTTYTFRRNGATAMFILGATLTQVQWWMGHMFTESNIPRNHFANPDEMLKLYRIIARRPLLNETSSDTPVVPLHKNAPYADVCHFRGQITAINAKVRIVIKPNVPYEPASVEIKSNKPGCAQYWQNPLESLETQKTQEASPVEVNMLGDHYDVYNKAMGEHNRQKQRLNDSKRQNE